MNEMRFPNWTLYKTRVTMGVVEYQLNANYNSGHSRKPIIGEFASSTVFNFETIPDNLLPLYNLVSRYYHNAEIGFETVDEFIQRFNDKWHNAVFKIKTLLSETGDFQIGSIFDVESSTRDENTLQHGYTDTYQRNGKNTTGTSGSGKAQNSVTQLEKTESKGQTETTYGEGATTTREMNGKTDTRETTNTRKTKDIEAEDIRQYLEMNFGQLFIEEFHTLFMEVIE